MIYDLGGGTLDVTILESRATTIRILTSEGARRLGGSNFDEELLDLLADVYRREHGVELWETERQRRRALQAGEDIKKMLSKLRTVTDTIGNERVGTHAHRNHARRLRGGDEPPVYTHAHARRAGARFGAT